VVVVRGGETVTDSRSVTAAVAESAAAASVAPTQSREERMQETRDFMHNARNSNTTAAYESGWRQFVEWATTVENKQRKVEARVDVDHPMELDVAQYCRYVITVKGNTMSSVHGAIAAIADRLRFVVSHEYNPCAGKVLKQMIAVLVPMATPAEQKKEITFEQMAQIARLARAVGTPTAMRDACMIQLAYHTFLRASEVARMDRGDITCTKETVWGEMQRVLRVHVNRLCKNDAEREGHERLVLERNAMVELCMVRQMQEYLQGRPGTSVQPLFPAESGERMSTSTPRHRLRYWLEQIGVEDASEYGFHSLRAGGATEAARAGVHERDIKAHGNWKSDAVRVYIRPSLEDRLLASSALGQ
jgi:integrase